MSVEWTDVLVPVYVGGRRDQAYIPVGHDTVSDVYTIKVSGELLDEGIERVTAAIQIALREVAGARAGYGEEGAG